MGLEIEIEKTRSNYTCISYKTCRYIARSIPAPFFLGHESDMVALSDNDECYLGWRYLVLEPSCLLPYYPQGRWKVNLVSVQLCTFGEFPYCESDRPLHLLLDGTRPPTRRLGRWIYAVAMSHCWIGRNFSKHSRGPVVSGGFKLKIRMHTVIISERSLAISWRGCWILVEA